MRAKSQQRTDLSNDCMVLRASSPSSTPEMIQIPSQDPTDEWELDCYSRPVVVNGKKLCSIKVCGIESYQSNKYIVLKLGLCRSLR